MRPTCVTRDQWYRLRVYAHQVRLEARKLRWQAAQARRRAGLIRLTQHMPHANPLTLEVTSAIFTQHGLWPDAASPAPHLTTPFHTPPGREPFPQSATG